jgi:hypothetical protein
MANTICNAEVQNLIDDIKRGAKEYFNLEFNIKASDLNNEEYRAMAIMFLDDIENGIANMDGDKLEYYGSTMFDFDCMVNDLRNYMMALEPTKQVNAKSKVKRPAKKTTKKAAKKTTKKVDRRCKAVRCITADGTVMEFASIKEAHEVTGISKTGISRCANGKQKTSGKCRWEFIK